MVGNTEEKNKNKKTVFQLTVLLLLELCTVPSAVLKLLATCSQRQSQHLRSAPTIEVRQFEIPHIFWTKLHNGSSSTNGDHTAALDQIPSSSMWLLSGLGQGIFYRVAVSGHDNIDHSVGHTGVT